MKPALTVKQIADKYCDARGAPRGRPKKLPPMPSRELAKALEQIQWVVSRVQEPHRREMTAAALRTVRAALEAYYGV